MAERVSRDIVRLRWLLERFEQPQVLLKAISTFWDIRIGYQMRRVVLGYESASITSLFLVRTEEYPEPMEYPRKKAEAASINRRLRESGCAIGHPDSGEPCLLLTVTSRDGHGRFALRSITTGKRSHRAASLAVYAPVMLVDAPVRKEGFAADEPEGEEVTLPLDFHVNKALESAAPSIEGRLQIAEKVNSFLAANGVALVLRRRRVGVGEKCVVKVIPSAKGEARYALESLRTGELVHSFGGITPLVEGTLLVRASGE